MLTPTAASVSRTKACGLSNDYFAVSGFLLGGKGGRICKMEFGFRFRFILICIGNDSSPRHLRKKVEQFWMEICCVQRWIRSAFLLSQ
jgi:hypothetical protein